MKTTTRWIAILSLLFVVFSSCTKQQQSSTTKANTLRMNVIREPSILGEGLRRQLEGSLGQLAAHRALCRLQALPRIRGRALAAHDLQQRSLGTCQLSFFLEPLASTRSVLLFAEQGRGLVAEGERSLHACDRLGVHLASA